jgi:hypothetical protein
MAWQKTKRINVPKNHMALWRATTIKTPQTAFNIGTQPAKLEHSDEEVSIQKAESATNKPSVRREGFFCGENEAVPHFGKIRPKKESANEVTIQEAAKSQNPNPNEYTIPAREVQNFAQRSAEPDDKIRKAAGREPKSPKYLPYPREPRHDDTNSGLDFDYAKSPNPRQTQLHSPASCRIKPWKNLTNSPPDSCLMKATHKAGWIYQAHFKRVLLC